jgi:ribosomal protein L15
MDNIFQIIIFIFVIWSIIGSALGKKKTQNKQQPMPRRIPREGSNNPSPNYRQSPQDVLEDILGFKIPKTEDEYSTGTNYELQDLEKSSQDLEKDTQEVNMRNKYEQALEDIDYDKLGSLEDMPLQQTKAETSDAYSQKYTTYSQTSQMRGKFRNKTSIRDAVILSEILNKPKALRRK